MDDKEYKTQKARVERLINTLQGQLGMNWWAITHEFIRLREEDEPNTVAMTSTLWEYRSAHVKWFMPSVQEQSDDELREVFIHEMSHILVGPTQDNTTDHARQMTEFAVTNVAKALCWALDLPVKKEGKDAISSKTSK